MADVIAYNGSDKWKQKATDLLNQGGGGGGGLVDDVKVNGTSVVDSDKVAQIDLTPYAESADLATVATTGSYDDLTDKPTIPAAQVQSDWTESDNTKKSYIKNKPNLATVATSGSYTDLSNKPTIPPTLSASGNIEIDSNVIKRKEVWLDSFAEYEALQSVDSNTDYHVKGIFAITFSANKVIITDNYGNLIASDITTEKLNQASDLTEAYRVVNGELYVVYDDGL